MVIAGLLAASSSIFYWKNFSWFKVRLFSNSNIGISEIILYFIKNEDWLSRGVKNVNGLPRPVPYEINLQNSKWLIELTEKFKFVTDNFFFYYS